VIVPRDAQGQPSRAEDRLKEHLEEMRRREMHPGKRHSTASLHMATAFFVCLLSNQIKLFIELFLWILLLLLLLLIIIIIIIIISHIVLFVFLVLSVVSGNIDEVVLKKTIPGIDMVSIFQC